jgi:hypothetical protein
MLPEVLNNHFDCITPDQIVPLIVAEGDNENYTSDSKESFHGFDSQSDKQSDTNVHKN